MTRKPPSKIVESTLCYTGCIHERVALLELRLKAVRSLASRCSNFCAHRQADVLRLGLKQSSPEAVRGIHRKEPEALSQFRKWALQNIWVPNIVPE